MRPAKFSEGYIGSQQAARKYLHMQHGKLLGMLERENVNGVEYHGRHCYIPFEWVKKKAKELKSFKKKKNGGFIRIELAYKKYETTTEELEIMKKEGKIDGLVENGSGYYVSHKWLEKTFRSKLKGQLVKDFRKDGYIYISQVARLLGVTVQHVSKMAIEPKGNWKELKTKHIGRYVCFKLKEVMKYKDSLLIHKGKVGVPLDKQVPNRKIYGKLKVNLEEQPSSEITMTVEIHNTSEQNPPIITEAI